MSTGPSGGSGGTTGPGKFLTAFLDAVRGRRARAQAAAELAGARAATTRPLPYGDRLSRYLAQSGRVTPRQRRRLESKARRADRVSASA